MLFSDFIKKQKEEKVSKTLLNNCILMDDCIKTLVSLLKEYSDLDKEFRISEDNFSVVEVKDKFGKSEFVGNSFLPFIEENSMKRRNIILISTASDLFNELKEILSKFKEWKYSTNKYYNNHYIFLNRNDSIRDNDDSFIVLCNLCNSNNTFFMTNIMAEIIKELDKNLSLNDYLKLNESSVDKIEYFNYKLNYTSESSKYEEKYNFNCTRLII